MASETKDQVNTWYMNIAVPDRKFFDEKYNEGHRILGYERGMAKMKVIPKAGDKVIVLSRKYIVFTGTVLTDLEPNRCPERGGMYLFAFDRVEPPVYLGKCFRRNYTLCKDEIAL